MNHDEGDMIFHLGEGCMEHGDEPMRECLKCGVEFCTRCFPRSPICSECSGAADEDDEFADLLGEDAEDEGEEEQEDSQPR